jgi:pyridoxamine 5'-phosphate oxidase
MAKRPAKKSRSSAAAAARSPLRPEREPFELFESWLRDARIAGIHNAEAMTLATATRKGVPSARMVLFKGLLRGGFSFYTHYESRKASELEANPHAALVFHWDSFERQVRIEGRVERCTKAESDRYYASRERGSRIGAWASPQSREISGREELDLRIAEIEKKFSGREQFPRPPYWGGYRVIPEVMEFWQGRPSRLHERTLYTRSGRGWTACLLAP